MLPKHIHRRLWMLQRQCVPMMVQQPSIQLHRCYTTPWLSKDDTQLAAWKLTIKNDPMEACQELERESSNYWPSLSEKLINLIRLRNLVKTLKSKSPDDHFMKGYQQLDRLLCEDIKKHMNIDELEVTRVTMKDTPTYLQGMLMEKERVHPFTSPDAIKQRTQAARRIYYLTHKSSPNMPLHMIQVALLKGPASSINEILKGTYSEEDEKEATTANFYSISSLHPGLAGIDLGHVMITKAVIQLAKDAPHIQQFFTFSPLPKARDWIDATFPQFTNNKEEDAIVSSPALQAYAAMHLALAKHPQSGYALNPVANFHLRNGARLAHIHLQGDASRMAESYQVMCNYEYQLELLEKRHHLYKDEKKVVIGPSITKLFKAYAKDIPSSLSEQTTLIEETF